MHQPLVKNKFWFLAIFSSIIWSYGFSQIVIFQSSVVISLFLVKVIFGQWESLQVGSCVLWNDPSNLITFLLSDILKDPRLFVTDIWFNCNVMRLQLKILIYWYLLDTFFMVNFYKCSMFAWKECIFWSCQTHALDMSSRSNLLIVLLRWSISLKTFCLLDQ